MKTYGIILVRILNLLIAMKMIAGAKLITVCVIFAIATVGIVFSSAGAKFLKCHILHISMWH